ncbi:hypothetical protein TrRE_jg6527, partial [Triparma retinervis]
MRGYWDNHTLLTEKEPKWGGPEEGSRTPDVVVVSLGGNDYNHHRGHVPDDGDFVAAYGDFMMEIFKSYVERSLAFAGRAAPQRQPTTLIITAAHPAPTSRRQFR